MRFGNYLTPCFGLLLACALLPLCARASWTVSEESEVSFLATKVYVKTQQSIIEINRFSDISGTVNDSGEAIITIALDSVERQLVGGITRTRRKRRFKLASLSSTATIQATIPKQLAEQQQAIFDVPATFILMGQEKDITLHIAMYKFDQKIRVVSYKPSIVKGTEFAMATSFVKLSKMTGFGYSVLDIPVSFNLVFTSTN